MNKLVSIFLKTKAVQDSLVNSGLDLTGADIDVSDDHFLRVKCGLKEFYVNYDEVSFFFFLKEEEI